MTKLRRYDIIAEQLRKLLFMEDFSMSTYMAKKETVERKWYIIDAANKPLGRTAATVATILRGKHRPEFTPHVDCGEFVIVINCEKAVLTGNKLDSEVLSHTLRLHRRTQGDFLQYADGYQARACYGRSLSRVCFPRTASEQRALRAFAGLSRSRARVSRHRSPFRTKLDFELLRKEVI